MPGGLRTARHCIFTGGVVKKNSGAGDSGLALSVTFGDTSPKGRGLGKEMKFAWTAKGSPFGRAVKADRH